MSIKSFALRSPARSGAILRHPLAGDGESKALGVSSRYFAALEERVVGRLTTEIARMLRSQQTADITALQAQDEASIQQALPPLPLQSARIWQNEQNASARTEFIEQCGGLLNSKQVADLLDSKAKNRAAMANHLKEKGRALCVRLHSQDCYPLFQFDPAGQCCYPEMGELIAILGRDYVPGWQLALWFITENDWLDGKTPLTVWSASRRAVVDAALAESAAFDD
jgi:hypothetical protein